MDRTVESSAPAFETGEADLLAAGSATVLLLLAVLVAVLIGRVAVHLSRRTAQAATAGGC